MDNTWAVRGAKVVYIGPPMLMNASVDGELRGRIPSPLIYGKVYTIYEVYPISHLIGIQLVEFMAGIFQSILFRPVSEQDKKMFQEMLDNIPDDIKHERIDQLLKELDHVHI